MRTMIRMVFMMIGDTATSVPRPRQALTGIVGPRKPSHGAREGSPGPAARRATSRRVLAPQHARYRAPARALLAAARWSARDEPVIGNQVKNLTIAASVWFVAAVGMVIGYGGFLIAGACAVYAVVVPRIPHVETWLEDQQDE